jgi:hypothetical protein
MALLYFRVIDPMHDLSIECFRVAVIDFAFRKADLSYLLSGGFPCVVVDSELERNFSSSV